MSDAEEIIRLAGRGDGLTSGGKFVPGTAPGDQVRFLADKVEIIKGPHHMAAACVHYGACGGCQLQHVDEASYALWAQERILHALSYHKLAPHIVMPMHISPSATRRRVALRARRMGKKILLGFNSEASHDIVDIQACAIMQPALFALLKPLRAVLQNILEDRQTIGVSITQADSGVDILLANLTAEKLSTIEALTDFAEQYDVARLSVEDSNGLFTIAARRDVVMHMGGVDVPVPPAPFLQATADGEAALVCAVLDICGARKKIADLFCGLGTFALPLSQNAQILAADGARGAVQALQTASRAAGRAIAVQHRDLFRNPLSAEDVQGFEAVVIDPPRAGAAAQCAALAQSAVPVIASVSCNPATFARDARTLADGGYSLQRLWPVAQFRWSNHIEVVGEFIRTT